MSLFTIKPPKPWMFGPSVEARNALQKSGAVHPMTCGNDRGSAVHREYQKAHPGEDLGQLIATETGWICPACGYVQAL